MTGTRLGWLLLLLAYGLSLALALTLPLGCAADPERRQRALDLQYQIDRAYQQRQDRRGVTCTTMGTITRCR